MANETLEKIKERLQKGPDGTKQVFGEVLDKVKAFVQEHPKSLLAGTAAGIGAYALSGGNKRLRRNKLLRLLLGGTAAYGTYALGRRLWEGTPLLDDSGNPITDENGNIVLDGGEKDYTEKQEPVLPKGKSNKALGRVQTASNVLLPTATGLAGARLGYNIGMNNVFTPMNAEGKVTYKDSYGRTAGATVDPTQAKWRQLWHRFRNPAADAAHEEFTIRRNNPQDLTAALDDLRARQMNRARVVANNNGVYESMEGVRGRLPMGTINRAKVLGASALGGVAGTTAGLLGNKYIVNPTFDFIRDRLVD